MPVATKIAALLAVLRRADIEILSPAERQHLAQQCRHIASMADPPAATPKTGVLRALKDGQRGH